MDPLSTLKRVIEQAGQDAVQVGPLAPVGSALSQLTGHAFGVPNANAAMGQGVFNGLGAGAELGPLGPLFRSLGVHPFQDSFANTATSPTFWQDAANSYPATGGIFNSLSNIISMFHGGPSTSTTPTGPSTAQSPNPYQNMPRNVQNTAATGDGPPQGEPPGSVDLTSVQAALTALGASPDLASKLNERQVGLVKLAAEAKQHGGNLTSKLATGEYIPPALVVDLITGGQVPSGLHTAKPIDINTALSNIYQNLLLAQQGGPHSLGSGALAAQAGPMTLADKQAGQAAMNAATPEQLNNVWAGIQAAAQKNGITLQDSDRQGALLNAYQQHAQYVRIGVATP